MFSVPLHSDAELTARFGSVQYNVHRGELQQALMKVRRQERDYRDNHDCYVWNFFGSKTLADSDKESRRGPLKLACLQAYLNEQDRLEGHRLRRDRRQGYPAASKRREQLSRPADWR